MAHKPHPQRKRRWLFLILLAPLIGLAVYGFMPLSPPQTPFQFTLKNGSTLRSAAGHMAEVGILKNPPIFVVLARALGKAGAVKAGTYELERPISPLNLLLLITRGEARLDSITFVEGWTFRQMRTALDTHPAVAHTLGSIGEKQLPELLGVEEPSVEGLFFPDTYFFSHGTKDVDILRKARAAMQSQLTTQWLSRRSDLPIATPYEALIVASIVEKETGREQDRPLVAAVLMNRLRLGMRLQVDPTVIYGLGDKFDGNLRKRDLIADQPYNTYVRVGLPPTPICMPGLSSLSAVLRPADNSALYFVSRGDGSTHFSSSLSAHEQAVNKYQKP